jgi:transcriptional regulator with XRE-family HTH domain
MSKEAVAFRLRAARTCIKPAVAQKDMAGEIGVSAQTYGNWETAVAYPSLTALRHFYRRYRVDFNFLLHGDYAQLPRDVQSDLFECLKEEQHRLDQKSS